MLHHKISDVCSTKYSAYGYMSKPLNERILDKAKNNRVGDTQNEGQILNIALIKSEN